ncbi:MAG TPA: hypothetical protein VLX59_06300 [Acidimicrobiales bacterium]|nr:hypothetical protein [Acidimicrobiales bacterium]
MYTLDRQPEPPEVRQYSQDLETYLVDAARSRRRTTALPVRRRLLAVTAGVALAAGAAFGIVQALTPGTPLRSHPPGQIQLATFSVNANPNGTVALTLSPGQLRDPAALRDALAQVGVPALVTANSVCYVPGPNATLTQVLSQPQRAANGSTMWTINRSAIPNGVELSIGYYQVRSGFGIHVTLVPEHAPLTCTATPPNPPRK